MGEIIFTYGFIALNDPLTEDTDKPTNPWLELILESNKNTEAPTAYWNDMQNALIQYGFWTRMENYSHSFTKVLGRLEVEEFYQKLCDASANDEIDFSGIEFREISFLGAKFLLPVNFNETQFSADANFKNSSFLAEAKFKLVNFRKSVCFENVNFSSSAIFDWAQFASASNKPTDHKVSFSGEIRSALTFTGCKFWSDLNFANVKYHKSPGLFTTVDFQLAELHGEARFFRVKFDSNYFVQCTFYQIAHFSNIEFAENANFGGSVFEGKLIFGTSGEGEAIVGRDFFWIVSKLSGMLFFRLKLRVTLIVMIHNLLTFWISNILRLLVKLSYQTYLLKVRLNCIT